MWYSIHSLLMVMSPSKKWKRGSSRTSAMRSVCMSMPYTSQSVVARMRLDRWWPMKPLTPRIRIRFMEGSGFFYFEEAQDFTIAAGGEPFAAVPVGAERFFGIRFVRQRGAENAHFFSKGPWKGRRHGAHQVVDLGGALRPVDAAVLRRAPAAVAAFGKVVGFQAYLVFDE